MIITITGANGFIGWHLVQDQLGRGRKVRAVDLSVSKLQGLGENPGLEIIQGDIRDMRKMHQAMNGVDVLFHLASAHLDVSLSDDVYREMNVEALGALVELAHQAGVGRFVHCSSVGVFGEIRNPPADETSPCYPDLVYEKTKLMGEEVVLNYYRKTGFPITVVRPVWVYGPGCHRTEKLIRSIQKGRFFIVGDGETMRHCIFIEDMVEAFECCAQKREAIGEVFIIGGESAVSINTLVREIAEIGNGSAPKLYLPLFLMKPLAAACEGVFTFMGKNPPISSRTLKFFTNNTSFSVVKARDLLGFTAKYGLHQGLRQTYDYMVGKKQRSAA
ncbi:MAG: NAD-dependent epimerase/dehydratase family protein [Nitrospirae bacterium]|nr:NAD-dependent epimerase/dehydratase family protein [Nitrospirota bacterium]